jgi:predicted transposase YbfD/YdcC
MFAKKGIDMQNELLSSFLSRLNSVPDIRQAKKVNYPLNEILFLTLNATLSDCTEWQEIVDFGNDKLDWLRQYYPYENGIPSHDTLNRALSLIDTEAFSDIFQSWANADLNLPEGTLISIDGKKLRGSATKAQQQTSRAEGGKGAVHLLGAWCNDIGLCLSVKEVDEKENEIKAIPYILNDLEIKGCMISIDAMGCHKKITENICLREANYVIGLKSNQKNLLKAAESIFANKENIPNTPEARYIEYTKDHGRAEERIYTVISSDCIIDAKVKEGWPTLQTIIRVESRRYTLATKKDSSDIRYYISSAKLSAELMGGYIRGHWGIENRLHWDLDVYWGEDASRKQANNIAANFGIILRTAHNLLKMVDVKMSIKRKLKKCARSDEYRQRILGK